MNLVSIIIPVYNVEQYLEKCLESVVNQTYKNLEIILVDDGSTDGSGNICDEYALKDNRIHVIHKNNEGVSKARITGFELSKGTFIYFLDSDDWLDLRCIELMVEQQAESNADLVCSQYYDFVDGVTINAPIRPDVGYYDKKRIVDLLSSNFLHDIRTGIAGMNPFLCTKLIRRKFVGAGLKCGQGLFYAEDQIGVLCLLNSINNMFVMAEPLYYYVKRTGQATNSYNPKLWHNISKYFAKIKEIDCNNLLDKQIVERKFFYTVMLVNMEIRFGGDFTSIHKRILQGLETDFCKDAINDINLSLSFKRQILHFLLRNRLIYGYILLYRVSAFLKTIL